MRLQSLWRRRPVVVAAAGGVVVLAAAFVIWANVADINWTAVGALGEWGAAVFAGLALIFAFRGWMATTQSLDLERQRHAADQTLRAEQERRIAAGLQLQAVEVSGSNRELRLRNVSPQPFTDIMINLILEPDADGDPPRKDSRYIHRLLPGEDHVVQLGEAEWSASYVDLATNRWFVAPNPAGVPELIGRRVYDHPVRPASAEPSVDGRDGDPHSGDTPHRQ